MKKLEKLEKKPFCCVCGKAFRKNTSAIALLDTKKQIHVDCAILYTRQEDARLAEKEGREPNTHIFGSDLDIYYTLFYEESDGKVPRELWEEKKRQHKVVRLPRNPIQIKTIIRDTRILPALDRKYFRELGRIHALSFAFSKHPEKFNTNFHKSFIPSVLRQFWTKGYLSEKQWETIDSCMRRMGWESENPYSSWRYTDPKDIKLDLPDMLHIAKKKKSFVRWYNKKNGIIEE